MLLLSLIAAAPSSVDLDDIEYWERSARKLVDGPQGCYQLAGTHKVTVVIHSPPSFRGRGGRRNLTFTGDFQGILDSGVWKGLQYTIREGSEIELPIWPLVGKIDESVVGVVRAGVTDKAVVAVEGTADAMNLLDGAIDAWDPESSVTFAKWNDDAAAVQLVQDVPLYDRDNSPVLTVTTTFPDGKDLPTAIDAMFPKRIKVGEWPAKVTVMDTQLHMRGQVFEGQVVPAVEGVSLVLGAFGFTVGYDQTLTYTNATPCP